MRSVAVANIKGGSGKTTLATHIAGWLAVQGHDTALVDLDRQLSAHAWLERRAADLPRIQGFDRSREWEPVKGVAFAVYDVPAAMKRKELEEVVRAADVLVVPVLPSAFDEDGTRRFFDVISEFKAVRKNRRAIAVVANRVRPRTRAAQRLEEFLGELGVPPVAHLRDAAAYANVAASGRTLFDESDARSRAPIEDWRPLLAFLDDALG